MTVDIATENMQRDTGADSPSSGEEELREWARPTPEELSRRCEKLALRKLPRGEQKRIREEAMRDRVSVSLARKKAVEDRMNSLRTPVNAWKADDPLSEFGSIFEQAQPNWKLFALETVESPIDGVRNLFNKAVFEVATTNFAFFRKNHNLLLQKDSTFTQKLRGELRIYIHEETTHSRHVYGLSIRGSLRKIKSITLFRESY